jgi:hypothetical protein
MTSVAVASVFPDVSLLPVRHEAHAPAHGQPSTPNAPHLGPVAAPSAVAGPPGPTNPLDALLHETHLPALPSLDQLFAPIQHLISSFGSGAFGAVNPSVVFTQVSGWLDTLMEVAGGAAGLLSQVWQGLAASDAHASGERGKANGNELSDQAHDIGSVTQSAVDAVNRGYTELVGIAQSFAATVAAAAPVLLTPPGISLLMQSAADHFARALAVVNRTRAELDKHTGELLAAAGGAIPTISPIAMAGIVKTAILELGLPIATQLGATATAVIQIATTPPTHETAAGAHTPTADHVAAGDDDHAARHDAPAQGDRSQRSDGPAHDGGASRRAHPGDRTSVAPRR